MKKLKDIQKLIEEKAEKRFNEEYYDVVRPIQQSKLFNDVPESQIFKVKRNQVTEDMQSAYWAFNQGYGIYEKLKEYWLPIYISEESERFMEDVERIKSYVDNLMNNQP